MCMYRIITIERSYASGGNEIGKKLAQALGYKLYNRNILIEAASNLGTPPMYIENLEETPSGSFIFNLSKTSLGGNAGEKSLPMADQLYKEEKNIIEKAAEEGGCVIIGRAAGYILKDRADCLRVFIHAEKEKRIQRAIELEGISPAEAENTLKKFDKRRNGFYNSVTNWKWGDPNYFELCLDSGKLGMDLCIKLLKEAASASE